MLQYIDIETVRHCNARCVFCPQSQDPLPANTMSIKLFENICKKIKETNVLHDKFHITLNHYGEPLLDKHFKERVKILDNYNIKFFLHTNSTKLDKDTALFLYNYKHLLDIDFNIVTLNETKWCNTYNLPSSQFKKTFDNLINFLYIFKNDLDKVRLNYSIKNQLEDIISYPIKVNWYSGQKNNRAGTLNETHNNKSFIKNTSYKSNTFMYGCKLTAFLQNFSINYKGDVFLCCQDYYQTSIVGNITEDSIWSIMNSDKANNLRDQIYGKIPADKNLICRNCNFSTIDFFDF